MQPRAVWANRYAIFDEIASGGMATVYAAGRLGRVNGRRVVAVKKLFEQYAKEPDFVSMFLDEARLAAEIRHPNVIRTYQVLRIPDSLAIVMELVVGVSLAELLRAARAREMETPLPIAGAVMVGALQGLHAAHHATDEMRRPFGLVHRDVSPQNLLLGKDGVTRVIDFGIAKAAGRLHVTTAGMRKGKFAYMAPEQIRGDEVGVAADVYAAGLILWELLVGWRFYEAPSDIALLAKRVSGEFPIVPPSCASPRVPATVDAIVMRALEPEPAARFQSADEMARAIGDALGVATEEEVAAWVTSLAHERLQVVEEKVREVDRAFDSGELEEPAPNASTPAQAGDVARPSVLVDALGPGGVGVHAWAAPDLQRLGADVQNPTSLAMRPIVDRVPPALVALAVPVPAPRVVASGTAAAPAPREPATPLAPAARGTVTARARFKRTARALRAPVLGAIGLVLVVCAVVGWPALLRGAVVRGAARRGVSVAFDRASVEGLGVALQGVTFGLLDGGALTVRAPAVHVTVDWLSNPQKVLVSDYTLTIGGGAADLARHFSTWGGTSASPLEVSGTSGHLAWSDAIAPGVSLRADDLSVRFALGGDTPALHVETANLTATVGGASLGPWVGRLETVPDQTRLVIALDRARPDSPPSVTLTATPALGELVSVTIPRHKFRYLGIPPTLFGLGADPEIDLTLTAQLLPAGDAINADARLALFGVAIQALADGPEPAAPANVTFAVGLAGPASGPLGVTHGTIAIRGIVSPIAGTVRLEPGGLVVELLPQALGGSRPIVLDTRTWTRAPEVAAPAAPPAAAAIDASAARDPH